jgi:hypothetical protein
MSYPLIEEIRTIRRELAERFYNNLDRIVADLQQRQKESGRLLLSLQTRSATPLIDLGGYRGKTQ